MDQPSTKRHQEKKKEIASDLCKHKGFLELENIICMKTGVAFYFISIFFNFILDFLPELLVKMYNVLKNETINNLFKPFI